MDSHHDPSSPWNSPTWFNPSPIQIPTHRRFSVRSDRERDAPDYARALSSDVTPYAPSIISSSDSNSYYRSSRGSRGSIASSLLCPLLDFHDSSRRQSDACAIMPMRPLPFIHPPLEPLPASNHFRIDAHYGNRQPSSFTKQTNSPSILSSSVMSNTTSTSGSNPFIPLRRRFLPNIDITSSTTKPRVETQLFGELLLALEEYVAAFGRKVKVSAPHPFSLGDSAAAVVVAAAVGPTNDHSYSDSTTSHLIRISHDHLSTLQNHETQLSDQQPHSNSLQPDNPQLEPEGQSDQLNNEQLDPTPQFTRLNSQSQCKVDRTLLSELFDELEYVTSEVIDVVPAFGEKLIQGHYGPLAVRGRVVSTMKRPSVSGTSAVLNQAQSGTGKPKPSTALERFVDYEPGGSQDTSDGGSGWWAERLLRDLLEGILPETVVKSGSTNILLSTSPNVSSSESVNMSQLSHSNSSDPSNRYEKTGSTPKKTNPISLGGRSKNWLRISQSTNLVSPSSIINSKSLSNRNLGFLQIDEDEEALTSEGKRKNDRSYKNPFNIRSNGDILMVDGTDSSNSTKQLLAEASQDSIFEYPDLPSFLKDHENLSKPNRSNSNNSISVDTKKPMILDPSTELNSIDQCQVSHDPGMIMKNTRKSEEETHDEHRQKLLHEGRKRWLAFKANQIETNHHYSRPSSHSDHRHTINNPFNFFNTSHSNRDGFSHQFRDSTMPRARTNSNSSLRNQPNHRYLYNYLAHHRS